MLGRSQEALRGMAGSATCLLEPLVSLGHGINNYWPVCESLTMPRAGQVRLQQRIGCHGVPDLQLLTRADPTERSGPFLFCWYV